MLCHAAPGYALAQGQSTSGPDIPQVNALCNMTMWWQSWHDRSFRVPDGMEHIGESLTCPKLCMSQVPKLVDRYMAGETMLDQYISHELPFDQVRPLSTAHAYMLWLQLRASLLTAYCNAVCQRPLDVGC